MNAPPGPEHPDATEVASLAPAHEDAIRASIASFLADEPERDERGHEIYLIELRSAIRMYLAPPATEPVSHTHVQPAEHFAGAFEALARSADSFAATLEGLDEHPRSRLVETTRLDAGALDNLMRLTDLAASEARKVGRQLLGEQLPVATVSNNPEIEFVERLSIVWKCHTQERIPRDREAEGPWARFVEVVCDVAGIDRADAHRARIRLYDSSTLDESAEILATVPDL